MHKLDALDLVCKQKKINSGAFVVFYRLVHHYNTTNGKCFPSLNTIARDTGYTTRTVSTHLRALASAGYIVVHSGKSSHGTNCYDLPVMTGKTECSEPENPRRKRQPNFSYKPFINPKANPFRKEVERLQAMVLKPTRRKQDAMKEAELEKALAEALGGGQAGLAALIGMPDPVLNEAKRSHLVDGVPSEVVIKAALNKIRDVDCG